MLVAVGQRIADDVHRIVDVGGRRQSLAQELDRSGWRVASFMPVLSRASVAIMPGRRRCDDGDVATLQWRLVGKGHRIVEQLLDRGGAQDARLLKSGLVSALGAGQRAGVGGDGPRAGGGVARLTAMDRRVAGHPPRHLHELAAVAQPLM